VSEPLVPVASPARAIIEPVGAWIDPLVALPALRGTAHPVLLHSGLQGHPASRFSILSNDPILVAALDGGEAILTWRESAGPREERRRLRDPLDFLRTLAPAGTVRRSAEGLPFLGGAIGYLGYGLRRSIERLPASPPDPLGQPQAWFGLYDGAVIFDHREGRVFLVATGIGGPDGSPREELARRRLERLRRRLETARSGSTGTGGSAARPGAGAPPSIHALPHTTRGEYLARVRRALEYIAAGDLYQVNLSHRIECPFSSDPLALFIDLARTNPAPFAAYLDGGDFQVVCASPERFVALAEDHATCSPIKGTRPRRPGAEEDGRMARELLASPKELAENVMIADLVRSDLGRVCTPGSVRAEALCSLESFATVHHLVSTVSGRLRPDRDRVDLLRALFPGGSMTGAPKVRAMEVIDELEGEERGVYSGSIGYLSLDGRMDFNIVIRTIVCSKGVAHLRVGGGIVADSDPRDEYRETLDKAKALLRVLDAGLRED
jgi:aminodeoxychorismate synthase component I